MKKYLIATLLIFTIITITVAQKKIDYIVFYKPYTTEMETNLYDAAAIKFDYNTQFNNVKNADIARDLRVAIKHMDYRFIGVDGNSYLVPGLMGYVKKRGVVGFGYLKKYEKYINKYKFKVIYGTSDSIDSNSPPLQNEASSYAKRYNKLLLPIINKLENR